MSRRALLLVDFFNPSGFGPGGYGRAALQAASRAAALKARCRRARIPSIYANDNFGRWQSEFSTISVTALDAHIRRYRVWIPSDCVAAEQLQHTRTALRSLARNAHARIAASTRPLPP